MDKKIVNVSSFGRIESLEKTLNSIYNQADEINVCLNDKINDFPEFLIKPKINLYITDNSKGDAFKFMFLNQNRGYYLTIDDDLIYPPNYVNFMIDKCKEYDNKKIVTLHGRSFNRFPIKSYYNEKAQRFYYNETLLKDTKVQFGGTGVMCFHTSLLKKSIEDFLTPNMADVWIGKFAKENNIEIICLSHHKNFIKTTPHIKTIYNDLKNNDIIQTNIVNDVYITDPIKKSLSIIIPTFNNTKYIDESLNTILNSGKNHNIEILVGIDGCEKTLNHIKEKTYPDFVKFYYFTTNNGPYSIKNSLAQISNSDNLLFFDSDDIMTESTISEIVSNIGYYDMVRLKYKELIDGKTQDDKENFHEGNFAIKKSTFLSMNGFEPWMCAADSDFLSRLYRRKPRIFHTKNLSVYYRRHSDSLTKRSDTGMASKLRGNYAKISKNKKGDGNPSILHTRPFEFITTEAFTLTKEHDFQLEIRNQKINSVLNKKDRKVAEVQPQKKQDPVVLDRLDFLYKNKSEEPRVIKTNKPNNRQELIDKKNGTTKNAIKEMFNKKPNYREGKNFINIGGKSRT